jgi:predicted amidohydrolase YtcJ
MGDSEAGSLLPGMRADLVVLATDPLACAKEDIAKCKVLATYVGGQELYSV